jgi:hypothetical protein
MYDGIELSVVVLLLLGLPLACYEVFFAAASGSLVFFEALAYALGGIGIVIVSAIVYDISTPGKLSVPPGIT